MRVEVLLLLVIVGAGNYLMRVLPLSLALRHVERDGGERGPDQATRPSAGPLAFVGPCIVAALLVTSVLPGPGEPAFGAELARTAAALPPTGVVAVRTGSFGLTVLVGVLAYWLVTLAVPP